jgi:hypothetical protein
MQSKHIPLNKGSDVEVKVLVPPQINDQQPYDEVK